MAEKEYIEREAALEAAKKSHLYFDIKPIINSIPAADVRPVVRATWEEYGDGEQKFYSCSNCFATHYRWDNFCPNCGADMGEES